MNVVQLSTMDISKAIPVTTSLIVAEYFGKDHKRITQDIKEVCERLYDITNEPSFVPIAQFFSESTNEDSTLKLGDYIVIKRTYIDTRNRQQSYYLINEQFWMMLVMGYTGAKAFRIKDEFIKKFYMMKNELLVRQTTRHIGKSFGRIPLTDSIKDHIEDGTNFKKFAYGNYTRLVYKRVLGMDVKKAKEQRKLKESDNLRDFMTIEELEKVQELESKIATFIEISDTEGKDDKQVYQMVKEWLDRESQNAAKVMADNMKNAMQSVPLNLENLKENVNKLLLCGDKK